MTLNEELKLYYASLDFNKARLLNTTQPYSTYVYMDQMRYGVIIPVSENYPVYFDEFSGFTVKTVEMSFDGKYSKVLLLMSKNKKNLDEFIIVATSFSDPGINGFLRENLVNNPHEWSNTWKQLFGNEIIKKEPYDILGELLVYNYLIDFDKTVKWTALDKGTHDFESDKHSYEVKTTTNKYESTITISSQNQLQSTVPLKLFFIRLEKNPNGICIEGIITLLSSKGVDMDSVENYLDKMNLQKGKIERKTKYAILEKRVYQIDDKFPKISSQEFDTLQFRNRIHKLTYTLDLSGLIYATW